LNEKQKERFVSLNYFDATKKPKLAQKAAYALFVRNPSSISLPALLAYDDNYGLQLWTTIMDWIANWRILLGEV